MADKKEIMFIRPKNCHWCEHGFYGLKHSVDYTNEKQMWNATDISKEDAVQPVIYDELNTTNQGAVYGFGHGGVSCFTGDTEEPVFTKSEAYMLNERIVYLLSCMTGQELGPAIINQGGEAFAGFVQEWKWVSANPGGDPYNDCYACCFYDSANVLWFTLADGNTFGEAVEASIDKYDYWISYWFESKNMYADTIIGLLAHDRDILVALGNMEAKLDTDAVGCREQTTQFDCEQNGCYWWDSDNSCHSTPYVHREENPCRVCTVNSVSAPEITIPVTLIVGGLVGLGIILPILKVKI